MDGLSGDLKARFGDCRVLAECSAADGLATLVELRARGDDVAVVIADHHMPAMTGVEFLARAHELHPDAKRVLLIDRDYSSTNPIVRAIALGRIDHHLTKPWLLRRGLYPAVTDMLAGWAKSSQEPLIKVFRIVGRQWDPRSHEIRERRRGASSRLDDIDRNGARSRTDPGAGAGGHRASAARPGRLTSGDPWVVDCLITIRPSSVTVPSYLGHA